MSLQKRAKTILSTRFVTFGTTPSYYIQTEVSMRSIRDRKNTVGNAENNTEFRNEADEFAAQYAGKSESELMQELMQKVSAAKSTGSFSVDQLDDFVRFVSPELDEQSRSRLSELVKMIKGGS